MVKIARNDAQFGTPLTYRGQQLGRDGELLYRFFNLDIDGKCPTFAVMPGDDIKDCMRRLQIRFAEKEAA